MSKKELTESQHIGILIFAVIIGVIVLTIAGILPQANNCETSAYWDGTQYTCHP